MNVEIINPNALLRSQDWAQFAQAFVQQLKVWTEKFNKVDLCLVCPDMIAFAWGIPFSWNSHISICHWYDKKYSPVMNLALLEKKLRIN